MALSCGVLGFVVLVMSYAFLGVRKAAGLIVASGLFLIAFFAGPEQDSGELDLTATEVRPRIPRTSTRGGYVSSQACVECHAEEHSSWSGSYHRTMTQAMTQAVTPESLAAPAEKAVLKSRGREFRFIPDGDRFLAETVDPEWDAGHFCSGIIDYVPGEETPYVRRQIAMSTGSHHSQTYWINGTQGNRLWRAPWVYHIQLEPWIPLLDTFLVPPSNHRNVSDWNDNCIHCHSPGGEPRLETAELPATRVGELGIACEACHGPGRKHVEHQKKTLRESIATISSPIGRSVWPVPQCEPV